MLTLVLRILFLLNLFIPLPVLAEDAAPSGFGAKANELMQPIGVLGDAITNICLILGIMFLFGAFLRYRLYRVNPLAAPLSTVIFLFILAFLLLSLPFLHYLVDYFSLEQN